MLRAAPIVALLISACGRIGFDPRGDGGRGDALDPDSSIDAAPLGPFGPPELITELVDTIATSNPTLTPDGLEMFMIKRPTTGDVFVSRRATTTAPWNPPVAVPELNSGGDESGLHLSRDGLTMYFASNRAGGLGNHDIYRASRPTLTQPFAAPVHLATVSTAGDESGPAVDGSELLLMITANPAPRDLYASERATTTAPWPPPAPIAGLDSSSDQSGPDPSPDGLAVYFASDRAGGLGAQDLYVATRPTRNDPFGTAVALTSINSTVADNTVWTSADGRTLYFASARSGTVLLYRATR